ncbi:HEAT repeat domain-containing protein [Candidatus Albibeggiatoa sp. nov. BB20]|uniref:HEAT repeat domain-containing protein n=1 Tax=Candidatus Albibeggiatoa sp. nov. BB20 TaxID=3162723 RepID=UPI0033656FA0
MILDQFEEFFNYQKYHQHDFKQFVTEIAEAIHDNATDTAFVIAMREDFALELNAFKEAMPTFLIDNFYRLERLSLTNARMAIEQPLHKQGFRYEMGLLDVLVHDLSEREKIERQGSQSQEWVMVELVEPPHLQIVCQQLWELDRHRADKEIKRATYEDKGKAQGLLENYFRDKIADFSYQNKLIASNSFNYLVNKHGTKMAYPLPDLAKQINTPKDELQTVLDQFELARVLRRQKRKETLWYELYHDMFSRSIYDWNERFKFRHRMYKVSLWGAGFVVAGIFAFGAYDFWDNSSHYHVRVNFAEGVNAPVQVWQGRHDGFDIWGQHTFLHELSYSRADIEPDKLFDVQGVWNIEHVHQEMIEELPLVERVQAYYEAGYLDKAVHDVANCAIGEINMQLSQSIIGDMRFFQTQDSFDLLINRLQTQQGSELTNSIDEVVKSMRVPLFIVKELLKNTDDNIRLLAVDYLVRLGTKQAETILIELLDDESLDIQQIAIEKAGLLRVQAAILKLIIFLDNKALQIHAMTALGKMGDKTLIPKLHQFLQSKNEVLKKQTIWSLFELKDKTVIPYTTILLNDSVSDVRSSAVDAIKSLGDQNALSLITPLLNDSVSDVRSSAVDAIKSLGDQNALSLITPLFNEYAHRVFYSDLGQNEQFQQTITKAFYSLLLPAKTAIFYEKTQLYFKIQNMLQKSKGDTIELSEKIQKAGFINLSRKLDLLSTFLVKSVNNNQIQRAIAENLVKLLQKSDNKTAFYSTFKQLILNEELDFWSRLKLFNNLSEINNQEVSDFIFEILENPDFDNDMQSFKFASYNALAPKRNNRAKTYLIQELDNLSKQKQQWRKTLKKPETAQNKCGQQQTNQAWKDAHWESRIAYSLAQNDPQYALKHLLKHPLTNVRQGAWQGLAFMMEDTKEVLSGGELFKKIYHLHHKTNQAYIRHATYRAIDLSLTSLEAVGTQQDLGKLEKLFKKHKKLETQPKQQTPQYKAILQRIEWSKAMLDHRLNQLNIDELRKRFKDELAEAEE